MASVIPPYTFKAFKFIKIKPQKCTGNEDELPRPRSGHRLVCHGVCLYAVGGYNPKITAEDYKDEEWQYTCPLFKELWQFNTLTRKWTKLCPSLDMPIELASHAAVAQGPYMIVFGGTAMPFGVATSNESHICHLPSGKWHKLQVRGQMPEPMYGQGILLKDNQLYVVGGTSGHEFSLDVHCLDIIEKIWKFCKPNLESRISPNPRYRHEVLEYQNKLYVFGGGQYEEAFSIDKLPTFHLDTQHWSITTTNPDVKTRRFPKKRKCHILQRVDKYVYIQGGIDGTIAYNDMWRLDLETWEWQELPCKSSTKLYFHSSAVTKDGCLYTFGGVVNGKEYLRTADITKIWLKIPLLQRMCWEALCHYFPNITDICPEKLLQLGISKHIVDGIHYPTPAFG